MLLISFSSYSSYSSSILIALLSTPTYLNYSDYISQLTSNYDNKVSNNNNSNNSNKININQTINSTTNEHLNNQTKSTNCGSCCENFDDNHSYYCTFTSTSKFNNNNNNNLKNFLRILLLERISSSERICAPQKRTTVCCLYRNTTITTTHTTKNLLFQSSSSSLFYYLRLLLLISENDQLYVQLQAYLIVMAQLFRFLFTDDRHRSEIFTFMIPSTFILEADTELRSRDFTSYNQKWSLSFHKLNGQLSAYLTLKSAYEGMTVTGEYGITLINREHFARNEIFYDKNGQFNYECASQGRKGFVSMETLCTLDFMDERGNIQCELEIKNINTTFSYDTQIPLTISRNSSSELKYVSNTFAFGNYEWNVCIQPRLDQMGNVICLKFYLCRLSSLDHLCKIVYRYKLINGAFVHDSGLIEQYSDVNGAANSYRMDKIKELLQVNGKFCVRIDLIKINSVFPIMLYPLSPQPQAVQFYDRDRQAWMMESCIEDNCFVLRLYYTDINNIPSGYVRVLSFNISVRHQQTGPVYVFKKPVIKYYYKRESDDGLEITTTIDASEMTSDNNGYLDQEGGITVEMEWYYSHLLHQPEYSHLDDIIRKQKLQMLREIQTLQNENYSLEKQIHILQAQGLINPNPQTGNMQTAQMPPQQQQLLLLQQQQQQQGPRAKSFDNPSGSSLSINGANPSLNSTNTNLAALNAGGVGVGGGGPGAGAAAGAGASNVLKKYIEQKYGSTTNMTGGAPGAMGGVGGVGPMGGMGNMSPQGNPMSALNDKLNQVRNGAPRGSTGLFGQTPFSSSTTANNNNTNFMNQHNINSPNNQNFSSNVGAGLSSLTSGITSGIANLKLQTGSIASKFMNPFSSN